MNHALVVHDGDVQVGDVLTVTGPITRVYGGGHLAVIDLVAGSVHVPLPGPNALPDGQVVVERIPQQVTADAAADQPGRCTSCGH